MAGVNMKKVKGDRYYGDTAEKYDAVRKQQPWWQTEQDEMKSLLGMLPRDLSVVDIPFGTGRFVLDYLERGFTVFGLDASEDMLKAAQTALGQDYEKCTAVTGLSTALPFADGQFDLLVSTRFLRDIILYRDVKTTMAEFARVTKGFAILQLGVRVVEPFEMPPENERMGSRMSWEQTDALLQTYGFRRMETRMVKGTRDKTSEIHHILCERV